MLGAPTLLPLLHTGSPKYAYAPRTQGRHTLKIGASLRHEVVSRSETAASAIDTSLDSTFIRSCEDGERHLEVMTGNVETEAGGRQVFAAVAKSGTDIKEQTAEASTRSGGPQTRR
jgi:hypothetical protein